MEIPAATAQPVAWVGYCHGLSGTSRPGTSRPLLPIPILHHLAPRPIVDWMPVREGRKPLTFNDFRQCPAAWLLRILGFQTLRLSLISGRAVGRVYPGPLRGMEAPRWSYSSARTGRGLRGRAVGCPVDAS